MRRQTVKTNVSKLLRRYPYQYRYELLAKDLGITTRWVRYLEKGEKTPGRSLRKLIKIFIEG